MRFPARHVRFFLLLGPLLLLTLTVAGCASTGETQKPDFVEGVWDVVVAGTPEGDLEGVLTVTKVAKGLAGEATFPALGPPVPFEEVSYEDDRLAFSARFDQGVQPTLFLGSADIEGDRIEGEVEVVGAGTFPLTGTRSTE